MKNAFHAYDIRGIYNQDFNKDDVYKIGFFISQLLDTKDIVVGRDGRLSSPEIHDALLKGITDSGANVHDIGLATTPMVYFATANYGFKAGVQITASHNPAEYNGLKISRENALPVGYDSGLEELEKLASSAPIKIADTKGKVIEMDIRHDYVEFQKKYVKDFDSINIGVDISNGAASVIIHDIWQSNFHYINSDLDGRFPNHSPNPLLPENTLQMQQLVREKGLDAGLVFDGDADRVVFVDDMGRQVKPDLIIAAMGPYFLSGGNSLQYPNKLVIEDIRTSRSVGEYLKRFGAEMYLWKVGRANAAPRLREINGVYGGEFAGHYYFRDFFFSDSGIMAANIMLQIVAKLKKQGKKLSELIDEITRYHNSGEINFKLEDKRGAMERVKDFYVSREKPTAFYDFDGYRVEYSDWWFNIRMSNTEPYLRLLCEAKTKELLDEKLKEISAMIY
ncbi:MAG: phosphomannomutase/phosphoglucomutase [Bacteroidales bacterium]|nr:phosphomannomutase/phosphoglucomutase [Bacteroidales bacterium]